MKYPTGTIVADWTEFGHRFQIEKLLEPKLVGAGLRTHRLWDNGHPATGGQWHYDEEGARDRASYLLLCEYSDRIRWLENRVGVLSRRLATGVGVPIGLLDRHGNPVHIGDKLRFDAREWGGSDNEFTVELEGGEILINGAPNDIEGWCEIIEPYRDEFERPVAR